MAVAIADDPNDRDEYKALIKLQKRGHYPFTVIRSASIWKNTGVATVPTIIVVNETGIIVGEYHGKDLLPDKCATLLKALKLQLLAEQTPNDQYWL